MTAYDGPMLMQLTQNYSTTGAGCQFPAWFSDNTWLDLTNRLQYSTQEGSVITYALSERKSERQKRRVLTKYQCIRLFEEEERNETLAGSDTETVMVLTKVLDDW